MKKRQRIVENVPKGWALLSGALWTKRIASQVVAHNGFITHTTTQGEGKGERGPMDIIAAYLTWCYPFRGDYFARFTLN